MGTTTQVLLLPSPSSADLYAYGELALRARGDPGELTSAAVDDIYFLAGDWELFLLVLLAVTCVQASSQQRLKCLLKLVRRLSGDLLALVMLIPSFVSQLAAISLPQFPPS